MRFTHGPDASCPPLLVPPRAFWILGISLVAAVACSGGSVAPKATGAPVAPTSLRAIAGPWPNEETDPTEYNNASLTSLGTDMVLAGTAPTTANDPDDRPAQFAVLDLDDDDGWQTLDTLPDVDGMRLYSSTADEAPQLATVGVDGDAYVLGARCADYSVDSDEPACRSPGDVELWRLAADDLEWERLTVATFEELTGSSNWALINVLGVVDGHIWAQLRNETTTIVAFDPYNGETDQIDRYDAMDHQAVAARCVTESGTIAGTALSRLATLQPKQAWVVHDHLEYDSDSRMACADDTIVLFQGSRWTEVGADGAVVEEGTSSWISSSNQWYPFAADDSVGFTVDSPHSVTVVADLRAEPLTKDYPTGQEQGPERVHLRGATRLSDGRIAALVDWPEHIGGEGDFADTYRGRTQLLIAE